MKRSAYLHGACRYELTGADPLLCFRRMTEAGISLWDIAQQHALTYTFYAPRSDAVSIEKIALRSCCELKMTAVYGLRRDIQRLLSRPFLVFGVFVAFLLGFFLQTRIWIIEVQDCEQADEAVILHALQDLGVKIGMRGKEIEEQSLKFELLQGIRDLSWVAVNRSGGRLTVLTLGREEEENRDLLSASHLVACRDGIITELTVLEGVELCKVGDSVSKGQTLVSGIEDYGLYLRAVESEGEIYGQTWHEGTMVHPAKWLEKTYTGRQWKGLSIIIGRKRINFSRNSSILGASCDKMVDSIQLRLFGYEFPVYFRREICKEYRTSEVPVDPHAAEEELRTAWTELVCSDMVAGRIEETQSTCIENGGLYILQGESLCHELISRSLPIHAPFEGE